MWTYRWGKWAETSRGSCYQNVTFPLVLGEKQTLKKLHGQMRGDWSGLLLLSWIQWILPCWKSCRFAKEGRTGCTETAVSISAYSLRPKHQASLETKQGKGYGRIAEELIPHKTANIQTSICQALNQSCLVYVQCHSLNSSCYELGDDLLQWKLLLTCPNMKKPFVPK